MTVFCFLLGRDFGERLLNPGKVKHGIVAEAAGTAQVVENDAFGCSAKSRQRLAVLGSGDDADESSLTLLRRHPAQLPQHTRIVRFIVGVLIGLVGFLSRIAGRVNAGRALQLLEQAFNGAPQMLAAAIGAMYTLKAKAQALMQMQTEDGLVTAGPSFEYIAPERRASRL